MRKQNMMRTLLTLGLATSSWVWAQAEGRTDGPEGSELGKGGYRSAPVNSPFTSNVSRFSLSLQGGGTLIDAQPLSGTNTRAPVFAGATVSFWADDWFAVDLSGSYLLNAERTQVLVGPKFRWPGWRVSGFVGLQAGAMYDRLKGLRFGLSPNVGLDVPLSDHWLVGGGAALDLPIGVTNDLLAGRLFLSVGYRF